MQPERVQGRVREGNEAAATGRTLGGADRCGKGPECRDRARLRSASSCFCFFLVDDAADARACVCVLLLLGIPIAYPRMVFLETALESKLNPLVALGRAGSMGLSGFVNKFNADAELLDDLVCVLLLLLVAGPAAPS